MAKITPVFRVFDYAKAIEFYVGWLGCKIEWEHKPEGTPFYMRLSIQGAGFDLSEHHGECSPGGRFTIEDFQGLTEFHRQLLDKQYKYNRPGLGVVEWDNAILEMTVIDPFSNRIIFNERT